MEANSAFENLEKLNYWLAQFHVPAQPSKTKAVAELKKIHINIYDLLDGRFHNFFKKCGDLLRYTRKRKLFYPLESAKAMGLKAFLRKFK
jgi:hypothetical protein